MKGTEEDKGIQFGYDKTNFKFFNIPNPNNPEDTFAYEPSRYDIGDGNGSVFDYVRSTCSHDNFIEALNALETELYFPDLKKEAKQFVQNAVKETIKELRENLKENMEGLNKAQDEYKELHKKWLIEATEADRVDEMINAALDRIKISYDNAINDVYTKVITEYPNIDQTLAGPEFLKFTANEAKKMVISELWLPSRNAQKAMNEDKAYRIDWEKQRKIWGKFPANVNMTAYAEKLLQDRCNEKGMFVPENTKAVIPPTSELLREKLKVILNEKAQKLDTIEYSRENYDKLFPFGIVETPVETVKLGERQFSKLELKDRERLLFAAYQTLKIPDIVFNEEKVNSDSKEIEKSHNYVKSFIFDTKTKAIQDIVVSIDGKNVSITSHPREINNVVNKIKNPDQLIFISDEIGNLLKQRELINNEQLIVEPTMEKLTHPLNIKYNENEVLSISDFNLIEVPENTKAVTKETELTPEDIELCKKVIPPAQFKFTMELTEGEEGEFFRNKMKEIAETYRRINTDSPLNNEDGTHTVGFRYFLGDTEIFLSEIDSDGIGFGYNILNGDLQMSEWGYTSLEEIMKIPYIEMDYHVPEEMTIERMLYQEHSEYFSEYAPKEEVIQERNATDEILDKIKAAGIEVVTDKKQFDEILESEDILQKMSNDEIIKNMAKQRDDAIEEKNRINAKKLEDFKAEVKSYAPLIKELIKTGNTLLENGFDLEGWKGHTGHYSDGSFYADGWTHKFGFKSSNGKIVAVGRSLGDDGEKYFIYSDGEIIDIGPYTFRYDHNYDWEPKGWLDGIQKFKTTLSQKFGLNFDNIGRTEKEITEVEKSNKINSENQIVNISKNEKEILSGALKETAEEFVSVVYSWENYRRIFDKSTLESPIETIRLGPNQFVKLSPGNRNNIMYAIRQTIENPSIILGKETWDKESESFKPVHLYGKSFVNDNNSEKLVESLIIFKEGNNIAVSLHPDGIDNFVEQIKTTNDIVYLDDEVSRVIGELSISKGDNVVKENENFLSRVRQVSYSSLGQESYPLINKNYNIDSLLSSKEFITSKGIETGKLEITKDNFDRYFNILNQHDAFKDKRDKIASELFNFHVHSENKDEMKKWLEEQGYTITEKEVTQYMTNNNGLTYGFVYNGKIYLNPDLMNSNAAVHEYTHLWDAYTQKTNPELWNKGLEIFRDTRYWNEVISDPNYQDIKDDEN